MKSFNWDRMKGGADDRLSTIEGNLALAELAEKSKPMAERIISIGQLNEVIRRRKREILDGTDFDRERIGEDLARQFPDAIPDIVEKGKETTALIWEIAMLIDAEDERVRKKLN